MPKLRVHNFTISLDGYAAEPNGFERWHLGGGGDRFARPTEPGNFDFDAGWNAVD